MTEPEHQVALAEALRLLREGNVERAGYFFLKAAECSTNDVEVLEGFVRPLLATAKDARGTGSAPSWLGHLGWLETFVRERAPFVGVSEIGRVLDLADDVGTERHQSEAQTDKVPTDVAEQLNRLKEGHLEGTVPAEAGALLARIDLVDQALTVALADKAIPAEKLDQLRRYQTTLRANAEADQAIQQIEALFDLAKHEHSLQGKAYCLQLCETPIRNLVVLRPTLKESRSARLDDLLKELADRSEKLAGETRATESERAWEAFQNHTVGARREMDDWSPPSVPAPNRHCKVQLERIAEVQKSLHMALPRLTHPDFANRAMIQTEELANLHVAASRAQHQAYNRWALQRIRSAYDECFGTLGTFVNDKPEMSKKLGKLLGAIDLRFATGEVQRCYSEVLEYYLSKLKGPGKKDSFDVEGSKLEALKQMANTEAKTPEDF